MESKGVGPGLAVEFLAGRSGGRLCLATVLCEFHGGLRLEMRCSLDSGRRGRTLKPQIDPVGLPLGGAYEKTIYTAESAKAMPIVIKLRSNLSLSNTLKQIEDLFSHESITFYSDSDSITSTDIPLPILSLDRRMYTRKNWMGINPFIFITSIKVSLSKLNEGENSG